jgi:hypothetical protein
MGKTIKYSLVGAVVGAAAAAAKARGGEASGDLPVQAAKGAGAGALTRGQLGFGIQRRSKRKLKKRMKLASMVSAGAIVEAARQARPTIEKQSRRARKAAIKAAKDAQRRGRRTAKKVGHRAAYTADLARIQADHLIDVGRHKLAS